MKCCKCKAVKPRFPTSQGSHKRTNSSLYGNLQKIDIQKHKK